MSKPFIRKMLGKNSHMTSKTWRSIILFLICCCFCPFLSADDSSHTHVSLYFPTTTVRPGTETEGVIEMRLDPEWHVYWKNPGETGVAPTFEWMLPPGITIENVSWPSPTRIQAGPTIFYGYSKVVKWLVRLKFDAHMEEATLPFFLNVFWVSCNSSCVPSYQQLTAQFTVSKHAPPPSQEDPLVTEAKRELPEEIDSAQLALNREQFCLTLTVPEEVPEDLSSVVFFPDMQGLFSIDMIPSYEVQGHTLKLSIPLAEEGRKLLTEAGRLAGIVQLLSRNGPPLSYAITVPLEPHTIMPTAECWKQPSTAKTKEAMQGDHYFYMILILAFGGGLLLNFMPCVLPVVGLKMLQLVSFRGMKRTVLHGLFFAFGILLAFWILAAILYFLQHLGAEFGWGFQLQQPLFVAGLIIVLFAFAMNLFGLFEMGIYVAQVAAGAETSHKGPSYLGSFLSGILATLIATPCTGPLLGSAIGFAATFDPKDGVILFTVIGLGMAFPYLLVSFFPILLAWLPRPGKWMLSLKQFLAFCLLATVVWLLWVLESEVTSLALIPLCIGFFLGAFSLWIMGRWGSFERSLATRVVAYLISFAIGIGGIFVFLSSFPSKANTWLSQFMPRYEQIDWEEFSTDLLEKKLLAGNVVFVDFSAKWCLLCQTNRIVFRSHKVVEAFEHNHIVPLEADWTNGDPHITDMLRSLGRNGVPVYAIFRPGKEPILLPELITPDMIVQVLISENSNHPDASKPRDSIDHKLGQYSNISQFAIVESRELSRGRGVTNFRKLALTIEEASH